VNTQSQLPAYQNNDSKKVLINFSALVCLFEVYHTVHWDLYELFILILYHQDQQLAPERISSQFHASSNFLYSSWEDTHLYSS